MRPFIDRSFFTTNHSKLHHHSHVDIKLFTTFIFIILVSIGLRLAFIFHSDLLVEEAYYWNYANHLDIGYLDHPPMVALLIKISTLLWGMNEFGVRFSAMLCWFFSAWFIFKLTQLIRHDAGMYAILLLSILPFFFIQSMVMTPDDPLILCWSASLYCLYRVLVKHEINFWYGSGIWMGLGLLSKYTMVLVGFSTLIYMLMVPECRVWFQRKEPYLSAAIAMIFFIPVILWNANHDWASFAFQSTRRFNAQDHFSFNQYLGLLILFLTPMGLVNLWSLYSKSSTPSGVSMEYKTKRFLQYYTLIPLVIFGTFSLKHQVKFNWMGPGLLAIIPWIAIAIADAWDQKYKHTLSAWKITVLLLLGGYTSLIFTGITGRPVWIYQAILTKYIDWNKLSKQVNQIAYDFEQKIHQPLTIIPLDHYNIGSELNFYQQKQLKNGMMTKIYPVIGSHIFGQQSLMFQYWSPHAKLSNQYLLLVSKDSNAFLSERIQHMTQKLSSTHEIWSKSSQNGSPIEPYYYQLVKMNPSISD